MTQLFSKTFALLMALQLSVFAYGFASFDLDNSMINLTQSDPDVQSTANLILKWEGPGGVILMLNNAEYVAQSGSTNEVSVPLNKALKVCIKKPFETLCAEYYLIVTEDGGMLHISEKDGRANFEFFSKGAQPKQHGQNQAPADVGMQGTLAPKQ